MPIRILPDIVAAQIAAGEVIERPASVVKELLENSLDAHASAIMIEVEQGGRRLIRVSDDGEGIPAEEARLAFARHATSKLRLVEDLDRINTLGFRGEALASIAAVSRTTLVSRHQNESTGVTLQVEGGDLRYERAIGAPVGTVMAVENLFFNTPARLKFLKSESTERKHIMQLVTRYAMAYPAVRFRLYQEGREVFHSTGSGDLADVLVEAFGLDVFKEMLEVSLTPSSRPDLPPIEVYGFASVPAVTRSNRGQIILFVNGRAISDQSLAYAVVRAYADRLPEGRYPVAVLLITLPPEEVDVNVHPTKAEVRFRAPDAVFAAVQRALRATLADQPAASTRQVAPYVGAAEGWQGSRYEEPLYVVPRAVEPFSRQLDMGLAGGDAPTGHDYVSGSASDDAAIPAGVGRPARPRTLPILRVIGQVGALYLVAEGPAGLYLIDQHAAHARVLYDYWTRQLTAGISVKQQAVNGVTVDLPPQAAHLIEGELDILAVLGFDIELFGAHTFRVRAVPAMLAAIDPSTVLHDLASALEADEGGDSDDLADRLLRRVCVVGAYKAGQVLNYDSMEELIRELERCETPLVGLDGGPTLVHISGEELARQFGR